jgi:hypothetical protein
MKIKSIFVLLIFAIMMAKVSNTFASNLQTSYDFYISADNISIQTESVDALLSDSADNQTLINKKIAPGTSGSFSINVNVSSYVRAEYELKFENFSTILPQNLKFYYNEQEINPYTFKLVDEKEEENACYTFSWKWEYETEDGDAIDLLDSQIGNVTYDITLKSEYKELTKKLPRSGDILANY